MPSPCPCRGCKAAYTVGYREGYEDKAEEAYYRGYRSGYNDHARSRAYAEAVYGSYQKGREDYIEEHFGLNDQP